MRTTEAAVVRTETTGAAAIATTTDTRPPETTDVPHAMTTTIGGARTGASETANAAGTIATARHGTMIGTALRETTTMTRTALHAITTEMRRAVHRAVLDTTVGTSSRHETADAIRLRPGRLRPRHAATTDIAIAQCQNLRPPSPSHLPRRPSKPSYGRNRSVWRPGKPNEKLRPRQLRRPHRPLRLLRLPKRA